MGPFLENTYNATPVQTGMVLAAYSFAVVLFNPIVGCIMDKELVPVVPFGGLLVSSLGNLIIASGFFFIHAVTHNNSAMEFIAAGIVISLLSRIK